MTKTIHIVAAGPKELLPHLSHSEKEDITWLGVDRGVYFILEMGITPDFAVGDFDSVTEKEWEIIEDKAPAIRRVQPEKDETDMELALMWAVKQNPSYIKVFGATGGRLDHLMANAFMLSYYQKQHPNVKMEIVDIQNQLSIYYPGKYELDRDSQKKYISFIPLKSEVAGLNLTGFKYPLVDQRVHFGSSLCISNELIQQSGTFSFEKGILMLIRSTD